ncbi:Tripartite tricarboxylate transporter TctB family protein [Cohaesibacter marisflavi]|uniref:Tripartite tricarboxylate transporter TctB family protein n=1 Tax=Cohaesibacter marisflavi TaxID=655353 RepID=A0A1I5HVD6_9HYPH|nr:tripartite tricarboxylate transporter TctB family protein [Cohaesibacter marisflavi]SFO52223.1 Tripartite tricarboxylate transporter TctB family protein [Cohaesibacter marisflavi]
MHTSFLRSPWFCGLLIAAFFAFVIFALIPVYVPRPAFIPGFAPPPDMWPRTVSIIGCALGLLLFVLALLGRAVESEALETDHAPKSVLITRFIGAMVVFIAYVLLLPYVGFLIASMALTGAMILLTGEKNYRYWAIGLTLLGPIVLQLVFHSALGTQFPVGILTKQFGF